MSKSKGPEPKWWRHARGLRKGGASWRTIAAEIGVSDRAVRYACCEEVREHMAEYFGRYYRKPKNRRRIIKAATTYRQRSRDHDPAL